MSTYKDLNTSYRTSIKETSPTVIDLESIKRGLERLFSTGKGEVPFNRNYGTTLKSLLFENNVDVSDAVMFLYMDITDNEPRISLNPADIEITQVNNNTYQITCAFTVPGLNNVTGVAQSTLSNN